MELDFELPDYDIHSIKPHEEFPFEDDMDCFKPLDDSNIDPISEDEIYEYETILPESTCEIVEQLKEAFSKISDYGILCSPCGLVCSELDIILIKMDEFEENSHSVWLTCLDCFCFYTGSSSLKCLSEYDGIIYTEDETCEYIESLLITNQSFRPSMTLKLQKSIFKIFQSNFVKKCREKSV